MIHYEQEAENFLEFAQLGCIRLLLNRFRLLVEDVE